jgi:8-oxo-dGTP pyrophosphatase MutT (NUDIX family)
MPIRDAATVVLLRDGASGLEVWLLTRVAQMAFAAGMSVFPGGRVDAADAGVPVIDADLAELARRLGCSADLARALVGCAARETFEETGVLLTRPAADLADARADVEAGRLGFAELLCERGLAVDGTAVQPWSRWVTPPGEARRYDARFFVGALPPGARAQDLTSESSAAAWVPVEDALAEARQGARGLLPPTLITLTGLRAYRTVADVFAAAPSDPIPPTHPVVRWGADGTPSVELPDGAIVPVPRSMFRSVQPG